MKRVFYILILSINSMNLFAQFNHNKIWVCGAYNVFKTTFNGFGVTNSYIDSTKFNYFAHGHTNICNTNGELQCMTNGYFLFDRNMNLMENGDSMVHKQIIDRYSFSPLSQSSLFLPFAGGKYYLFTPTASDYEINNYWNVPMNGRALFDELLYHVIDMNANSGLGKVIRKKIPLLQNVRLSKTNMMACKHGNGTDYWLFKQGHDSNYVYKFLVTQDSIYNYGIQEFSGFRFGKWDQGGQAMFSKDGTKYAVCIRGGGQTISMNPPPVGPGKFFVADFDRCNGMLSNPKYYQTKPSSCQNPFDTTCMENFTEGLCFSPSGRFLYISSYYSIKQLDLWDADTTTQWSYIHGLDTSYDYFQDYASMYLGPDNKLYIGNWSTLSKQMSVINNPDNKGVACNFCPRCLRFPDYGAADPPCMAHYELGPAPIGGNCWPLENEYNEEWKNSFAIFPNPAHHEVQIKYSIQPNEISAVEVFDVVGRLVKSIPLKSNQQQAIIDMTELVAGTYVYRYLVNHHQVHAGKLVVQH